MLSRAQEDRVREILGNGPPGTLPVYCLEHLAAAAYVPVTHLADLAAFVRNLRVSGACQTQYGGSCGAGGHATARLLTRFGRVRPARRPVVPCECQADETAASLDPALIRAGWSGSGRRTALRNGVALGSVTPLMDRRAFLGTLAGSLLAPPLAARAQQAAVKIPLIGLLDLGAPDAARLNWWNAFRQAIRESGYVEGKSIRFEACWAQGRYDRLLDLAGELVRLKTDVIVTAGGEAARAAKQVTATIPIVMATGSDPAKRGIVKTLGRPGGNVTGLSSLSSELISKRVELLKGLLPKISRVAILWDETPNSRLSVQESEDAARTLGLRVRSVSARTSDEFGRAFSTGANEGAVIVVGSPFMFSERKRIADLALKHRLPTVVGGQEYAEAGALLSYAVSFPDLFRRAAWYVDKILRGAKPADLPVEQPNAFELVINLKTAKALGLTIPPSLLQRADQVIE